MLVKQPNAFLALVLAGVTFGLTIPFSKVALEWLDPLWLGVARFGLAAPLLALVASRGLRSACSPAVLGWGIVFYGGVLALQNYGIGRMSVSHAALIFGTVPALVAVVSVVRGRGNAGPLAWIGFAAAALGVVLVAGAGGATSPAGAGMLLGAALLSAVYIVAQPRLLEGRNPVAVTAVQMMAGAIATLPVASLVEGSPVVAPSEQALWAFAGLLVVGSVLPFALYAYGQARVAPEVAGAFVNLEPLVGAAVGALAFHDPFGPVQILGTLAILGGIALSAVGGGARVAPA